MKIQITFKDPDHLADVVWIFQDEQELSKRDSDRLKQCFSTFFEYDEYVTIEFDLDKVTARVVPLCE